jgi:hypothetical protein
MSLALDACQSCGNLCGDVLVSWWLKRGPRADCSERGPGPRFTTALLAAMHSLGADISLSRTVLPDRRHLVGGALIHRAVEHQFARQLSGPRCSEVFYLSRKNRWRQLPLLGINRVSRRDVTADWLRSSSYQPLASREPAMNPSYSPYPISDDQLPAVYAKLNASTWPQVLSEEVARLRHASEEHWTLTAGPVVSMVGGLLLAALPFFVWSAEQLRAFSDNHLAGFVSGFPSLMYWVLVFASFWVGAAFSGTWVETQGLQEALNLQRELRPLRTVPGGCERALQLLSSPAAKAYQEAVLATGREMLLVDLENMKELAAKHALEDELRQKKEKAEADYWQKKEKADADCRQLHRVPR